MPPQEQTYSASPEQPSGDAPPSGRGDTFFLPPDYPDSDKLKPGDEVTLKVVGRDEDGNVEVECGDSPEEQQEPQESKWTDGLDEAMGTPKNLNQ